jgi:hypothetical protein
MENTDKEKFESLWRDFVALVKGKLITTANKQMLSTPLANLILNDAKASWGSEYDINGKWLSKLTEVEPDKAALIRAVLLDDMTFTNVETNKPFPSYYNYIVPTAGAIAGLVVSACVGATKLIQGVSAIVPAVLLYPAVKAYGKQRDDMNRDKDIEAYIHQLEKYKNSIVSILS